MHTTMIHGARAALLAAALVAPVVPAARAADIQVQVQTQNSGSNPGPFSGGASAIFDMRFTVGGEMTMVGGLPTWVGGMDNLEISIQDANLGNLVIHAQNGSWRQIRTSGDFLVGGWGGSVAGSSITPFSVVNPAKSGSPYTLQSISLDFRGSNLFAGPATLPGPLTIGDFNFLSLVLDFDTAGPVLEPFSESSIIRFAAFSAVTITPVPEPQRVVMLVAGLALLGAVARRLLR